MAAAGAQQRQRTSSTRSSSSSAASSSKVQPPRRRPPHQPQQPQQPQQQAAPATASATSPPRLPDSTLLSFERRGFLVTRQLLDPQLVQQVKQVVDSVVQQRRLEALRHRVRVLVPGYSHPERIQSEQQALALIQQQGSSELGFLQFFNLHRSQPAIAQLVRHPALAGTAAQLLGAPRLRLYQDAVFLKQPGFAETNWHSDLRMAPLDTNDFVTAWIPLRNIGAAASSSGRKGRGISSGAGDSGLVFAAGSHRDFALPFWHDLDGRDLGDRGYQLCDTGPLALGDVSWHHGWTLHGAPPQPPGSAPRLALAVSFFADGARVLARRQGSSVRRSLLHDEDAESYADWLSALRDGAHARHALLPLVHPGGAARGRGGGSGGGDLDRAA